MRTIVMCCSAGTPTVSWTAPRDVKIQGFFCGGTFVLSSDPDLVTTDISTPAATFENVLLFGTLTVSAGLSGLNVPVNKGQTIYLNGGGSARQLMLFV